MWREISYDNAKNNLASLLDMVTEEQEIIVINHRGRADVAMIKALDLNGLLETVHLLRSPKNSRRLLKSLRRAQARIQKPNP